MKNRVSGASSGSNHPSYVPPDEGGGQSSGSAPPAWLPSSAAPVTRVSSGPAAPRAASQTSRVGGWLSALTSPHRSQAPERQPLLDSEGSGSREQEAPSRAPSAASPSHSPRVPPGSSAGQELRRLAPPARGGTLFQAYADINSVTSSAGGNSRWPATIQHNVELEVNRTARGEIPEHDRQEALAELASMQKNRLDEGSGGS